MMRRSLSTLAPPVSPLALQNLRKKVLVRNAISKSQKVAISTEEFLALATTAADKTTGIPSDNMSTEEATQFLRALHEARVVIHAEEQKIVHIKPIVALNRIQKKMSLPAIDPAIADRQALEGVLDKVEKMEKRAAPAFVETATGRKRFWSAVAIGSGAQMTAMSYLTFVAYGWDTMEPISYFLTSFTAIFFYAYFLLFRREHTFEDVDLNKLPRTLDRKLQSVDVPQWMSLLEEANTLEKVVQATEEVTSENVAVVTPNKSTQ